MKKWLAAGFVVMLTGAAAMEISTHALRGWWAGESFYRGRPTTYWSQQLSQWRSVLG